MNNKLILTLVFVGFGVACGGDDDGTRRGQQGYETVQEGSAAGVTSTIQGPGESLPPLTGTNADTTTAFTIDPNAVASAPTQSAPGTLAGTLPPPVSTQYPPPMTSSPATASPAPPPSRSTAPAVRTQPAPQREPAAPPPDTDTAVTPTQTAPPTQTAAPTQTAPRTNTAPPPPPRQEEQEEEDEEEEPPPPTSTDTRGGQR